MQGHTATEKQSWNMRFKFTASTVPHCPARMLVWIHTCVQDTEEEEIDKVPRGQSGLLC